eukprot:TRINITY_DN1707_c0_g1_i2.p1 TRINITY_DN1707_c0_g1~~TRINITY_DN1707_c0_g1_i2.p1  ORF type:complete len:154 (+),score=40.93 TRINITY_DN1707_c0_g1_i2:6-467(+)
MRKRDSSSLENDDDEDELFIEKVSDKDELIKLCVKNIKLKKKNDELMRELKELKKIKMKEENKDSNKVIGGVPLLYYPNEATKNFFYVVNIPNEWSFLPKLMQVLHFNEASSMMLGYSPNEIVGEQYSKIYPSFHPDIQNNLAMVKKKCFEDE